MKYLFLSDLHLGAGDLLEDFLDWGPLVGGPEPAERAAAVARLDARLAAFLGAQLSGGKEASEQPPHVVLLGDTFDLWQVLREGEAPAEALLRIASAHRPVIAALRHWAAAGGAITVVVGNHDQPMVDRDAWACLRELLPTVNAHADGQPVHYFADDEAGIYAEHGHQWDPFNRLRDLSRPHATCVGLRMVRHVVNALEPELPLIDKGATLVDLMELLWREGFGEALPSWAAAVEEVVRLVGRAAGPAALLVRELEKWLGDPRHDPDFSVVAESRERSWERALRLASSPRPRGTIGSLPARLRFLLSGHTHRPAHELRPTRGRSAPVEYLNPGTWRPVLTHEAGHAIVRQTPTAVVVLREASEWRARVVEG